MNRRTSERVELERSASESCTRCMRRLVIAPLVLAATACTVSPATSPVAPNTKPSPSKAARACPATLPAGDHRAGDPAGLGRSGYGNGTLWVGLWPHGHVLARADNVNRHGEIVMKFPWDRSVSGRLRISGHRIEADAPPLRAPIIDPRPKGFQPTTLVFPTEGCWQVTGTIRGVSLTFVTKVTVRA
jgi:hypothetical protein